MLENQITVGNGVLSWSLYPIAQLRSTGMPVTLSVSLSFPNAVTALQQADESYKAVLAERQVFETELWPRAVEVAQHDALEKRRDLRVLYRARRTVQKTESLSEEQVACWKEYGDYRWPIKWANCLSRWRRHEDEARTIHGYCFDEARRKLVEHFRDARLQHAIFLSNPDFQRRLENRRTGSTKRKLLQVDLTLHRYLSRFCVKCETTSFFGPILFITFDPTTPTSLHLKAPDGEKIFVEVSAWLAEELRKILTKQLPLPQLTARRNPLFIEKDGLLIRVVDGSRVRISNEAREFWRKADGNCTLGALSQTLGITPARLVELIGELKALVILGPEIPATELRPLDRLAGYDINGGVIQQMHALRNAFATAPWPGRQREFAAAEALCRTLSIDTHRGNGKHYADRSIFHEDRSSPLSNKVTIGGTALFGLRSALRTILPVCFLSALLAREDAREGVRRVLQEESRPLAWLARQEIPIVHRRVEALQGILSRLSRKRLCADSIVRLSSDEIAEATHFLWDDFLDGVELEACLPSPDMMAIGESIADATWLLSELHDDASSIFGGFSAALHPNEKQLETDFEESVSKLIDPQNMATIVSRRHMKHVTPELPGLTIELSGRSKKPRPETAPIAVAIVEPQAKYIVADNRRLQLYPGDLKSPLHRALALPALTPISIEFGNWTPRIMIDGVIFQRAHWRLELPPKGSGYVYWQQFHQLRQEYGIPRYVFVRHPDEAKPLYVDFADPLSVEGIAQLPSRQVVITEMLPTPEQLWWRPLDKFECAELRMACLVQYQRR